MKSTKKKITMFFLAALMLSESSDSVLAAVSQSDAGIDTAAEAALADMKLVTENDDLELYLDETETDIAVRDKASGEIWFSNPIDSEQDTSSSEYYLKVLKSQIDLTYINEDTQVSTMDNYNDAIVDGQFEIAYQDDGVKITYTMGEGGSTLLLPEVITEERLLAFEEQMEDTQVRKIDRNYSQNDEGNYELRGGVKDYIKEELAEYFAEAGYTQEDYDTDSQESDGSEEDDSLWFTVPITYTLDGANLVATVDPQEVSYNTNGYYLVSIDILRYFGASLSEDGYLFVPDGSGALIHFDNGKTTAASYGASVYGQDATMISNTTAKSQVDAENTVKMPVFGIRDGEKALFAVIEQGDGYATINGEVSGKTTGYNDVYAGFSYLQYGETSLDDVVGSNSYYMYSKAAFSGSYSLRYSFLTGEDANYSGMAACYQKYLVDQGVLTDSVTSEELPFYVEYIGAIDKDKTFLGIKYSAIEPLTTFAQAEEITQQLNDLGVADTRTIYSGWMNGGLHSTASTQLNVISKLQKGGVSLSDYLEDQAENPLYLTVDLQYVYQNELLDGYSTMKYAPRYFDNTSVTVQEYGLASQEAESTLADLISPKYVLSLTEKFGAKLQKKGISGLNLGTLSSELYSDLSDENYTDRQMALEENTSSMASLQEAGNALIGDNANAYTWQYAQELINVPMSSNSYQIIDEDIPFYEMVLHGYLQYSGEALNLSDDYETAVLKSVESGAGIQFKWIYEDNSVLKETDYDNLYSVNYEAWLEQATELYQTLNQEMGTLQSQKITGHESVAEDVVAVTYEDGTRVYVNYSQQDVTVDGTKVEARNYKIERGTAK